MSKMKEIKVLLTEAGGPAGVSAVKSFRKIPNIKIVGMDANKSAAGLLLCDERCVCPLSNNEIEYKDYFLNVIETQKINFIIPTGESGLKTISSLKKSLPCKTYLSDLDVISVCQNKWEFYKKFKNDLPLPLTINKKLIKKLVSSSGSKDISIINCDKNYIIQEYIDGTEYTIDAFFDDVGNLVCHIIREREEVKAGISVKSNIIEDESISSLVFSISSMIKFVGPINIQVIKNNDGIIKIVEINPRLSGTSIVSTLAGFNFAEYYFNLYYGLKCDTIYVKKISVSRYYEEIVI